MERHVCEVNQAIISHDSIFFVRKKGKARWEPAEDGSGLREQRPFEVCFLDTLQCAIVVGS